MTIKVGDKLPAGTLSANSSKSKPAAARSGPTTFKVDELTKGKKVVIFGLPGAFTPDLLGASTCRAICSTTTS